MDIVVDYYGARLDCMKFCKRFPDSVKILGALTTIEEGTPYKGLPKRLEAYIIDRPYIYLPRRMIGCLGDISVNDRTAVFRPLIFDRPKNMFGYQINMLGIVCKKLRQDHSVYLQMPTGSGKTLVTIAVIQTLKASALIIVPTLHIQSQWINEMKKWAPEVDCSAKFSADVAVCVINTFRSRIDIVKGFGIIVFDEVHELLSKCNSKALWAHANYVIGISATPSPASSKGLYRHVYRFIGKPVQCDVEMPTFDHDLWICKYYGASEYVKPVLSQTGSRSAILSIGRLIKDSKRLQYIVTICKRINAIKLVGWLSRANRGSEYIKSFIPKSRHGIFIFAEYRDYLDDIRNALLKEFSSSDIDIPELSILRGGIDRKQVKDIDRKGAHIILTTYGYSRRGVSIQEMTSLILATPRKNNLEQVVGRIGRAGSDMSIRRIVADVIDSNSYLSSQFEVRELAYRAKNMSVKYIK